MRFIIPYPTYGQPLNTASTVWTRYPNGVKDVQYWTSLTKRVKKRVKTVWVLDLLSRNFIPM
jgi:hypothetical protein